MMMQVAQSGRTAAPDPVDAVQPLPVANAVVDPVAGIAASLERAEIQQRVDAFRHQQIKLRLQREEYYNATLKRTRVALDRFDA